MEGRPWRKKQAPRRAAEPQRDVSIYVLLECFTAPRVYVELTRFGDPPHTLVLNMAEGLSLESGRAAQPELPTKTSEGRPL